jgi:hypothetical protein
MWTAIQLAIAGLGPLAWHWGLGVGLIIIILAIEYFTAAIGVGIPILAPLLEKIRKDLLWVAIGIALLLAGEYIGAKDAADRCRAKETVIEKVVTKAVAKAKHAPKRKDKWDVDK